MLTNLLMAVSVKDAVKCGNVMKLFTNDVQNIGRKTNSEMATSLRYDLNEKNGNILMNKLNI